MNYKTGLKKDAVRMLSELETTTAFVSTLLAYFDDDVAKAYFSESGEL